MALRISPVVSLSQLVGVSLHGSIVGFRVRLLLVDTSAAWNRTISTKFIQRNDACPACFAACAGEKSNVVISPTLSLSPTSSSCRKWTTLLHFESARDCSNVYFVNGAVFCPPQLRGETLLSCVPLLCLLRACGPWHLSRCLLSFPGSC